MDIKTLVNRVFKTILPLAEQEAGMQTTAPIDPKANMLLGPIKQIVESDYSKLVGDIDDVDRHAAFRMALKDRLNENPPLRDLIAGMLGSAESDSGNSDTDKSTTVSDSKNVVAGENKINAGGNINIGDKNTEIKNEAENIYQAEVINITQVIEKGRTDSGRRTPQSLSEVNNLVQSNKIKQALEHLLQYTKNRDNEYFNQVTLLTARWNRLQTDIRSGVISRDAASVEYSRIVVGVVDIVNELDS